MIKFQMRLTLIVLLLSLLSSHVWAAAIGMPDYVERWGVSPALTMLKVSDPNGDTESQLVLQPLNVVLVRDYLKSGLRYWGEAYYHRTSFDAKQSSVGLTLQQLGARLSAQKKVQVPSIRQGDFFAGGGLQLAYNQYSKRHTVDVNGYLAERYSDDKSLEASLLLNVVYEHEINERWSGALKLEHALPINENVNATSLSFVVFF